MNIEKTKDSKYTITTEKEQKSFSSPEEAKIYLKGTGLSDTQINELFNTGNHSSITKVTRKTSITFGKPSLTMPSFKYCPNCKKELRLPQKNCPYCFKDIKRPFWKKILGVE